MTICCQTETLKHTLEALPPVVFVDEIMIEDDIILSLSIKTRAIGKITLCQLDIRDAPRLFEFYSEGLSEKARRLFAPYPLFHTPPDSANELAQRIVDWKKENVKYVIMPNLRQNPKKNNGRIINTIQRMLGPVVQKYPEKLKLLKTEGTDEPAYLYEINY